MTIDTYRFGMVMFDDPLNPEAGWVSIDGDEASRIDSRSALSTDIIWWSNLNYSQFFPPHSEVWRIFNLRHDAYLVVKPGNVAQEWGVDPKVVSPDQMATLCAQIFSRIMRTARALARKATGKIDGEVFIHPTLREDLRVLLPKADFPRGEEASLLRNEVTFLDISRTTIQVRFGTPTVKLIRPRIDHAYDMLTTPVPEAPFVYHPGSSLPRPRDMAEMSQPVMANLVLRRMDPAIGPVFAFGNSMKKGRRLPRTYVPHPELAAMIRISDIEVHGAFIGRGYTEFASQIPEIVKAFLDSREAAMSWTSGIVAETIWRAATLGMEEADGRFYRPGDLKPHTSWRGLWVKSADKLAMFTRALRLSKAGFPVLTYGLGWVMVAVSPERTADLPVEAWKVGLVPQLSNIDKPLSESRLQDISWGGRPASRIAASMTLRKEEDMLWNLDRLPTATRAERAQILESVTTSQA